MKRINDNETAAPMPLTDESLAGVCGGGDYYYASREQRDGGDDDPGTIVIIDRDGP